MRISTIQAFNNGISGIQKNYANAIKTQEQITTGNRILTPSDDPVASVRLLQLEQQQNVLGQYKENLTAANNALTQEEVTLNSVNTVLQRVRELAVEAGNGSRSAADLKSIAAELAEREEELYGLMNTKNARGEYLFSGFQGKSQPFVRAGDGSYSYQGDEGQRKLQVASSVDLAISDNGKKIFQNIINADRLDSAISNPIPAGSTLTASAPLVQDETAFAAGGSFPAAGITIEFDAAPNERNYRVINQDTNAVLSSGRIDEDADPNQLVFQGISIKLSGQLVGGEQVSITNDPSRQKQGVLDTIANLRRSLNGEPGAQSVSDAVAASLANFDNAMTQVDSVRGEIGARLNVIETTLTDNEDTTLVNKAVQSSLREVDYPEALSKLALQSTILEAAQQSYVKISGLSLFNKM